MEPVPHLGEDLGREAGIVGRLDDRTPRGAALGGRVDAEGPHHHLDARAPAGVLDIADEFEGHDGVLEVLEVLRVHAPADRHPAEFAAMGAHGRAARAPGVLGARLAGHGVELPEGLAFFAENEAKKTAGELGIGTAAQDRDRVGVDVHLARGVDVGHAVGVARLGHGLGLAASIEVDREAHRGVARADI